MGVLTLGINVVGTQKAFTCRCRLRTDTFMEAFIAGCLDVHLINVEFYTKCESTEKYFIFAERSMKSMVQSGYIEVVN